MKTKYKINDLCNVQSGGTPRRGVDGYYGGIIPWAKIGDIENADNGFITQTQETITEQGLRSINNRLFPKNTVLLAMYGSVGKTAIAGKEISTNQAILGINPKDTNLLDFRFLKYFLDFSKANLVNRARGVALQNISATIVKEFEINLPDIEQQRITINTLDQADSLRQKRKQAIDLLDEYLKSVFLEMFGDPVKNPKKWEQKSSINYANCIVPGRDKPKSFSGDIPWVTTDDLVHLGITYSSKKKLGLTNSELNKVRAKIIPKNSVIITCVGDLGVVSIAGNDMVVNQQLHTFQCFENMNNIFFMYAISYQKDYMYRRASNTTVPYLNKTECNGIPMICPPILLQRKFAETVEITERTKQMMQSQSIELDNQFNALMQKHFSSN